MSVLSRRHFVVGPRGSEHWAAGGVWAAAVAGRAGTSENATSRLFCVGEPSRLDDQFRRGLLDLGYVEGQNIVIEYRFVHGSSVDQVRQQAAEQAAELVNLPVDVIAAALVGPVGVARAATATIPIVMLTSGDPVGDGFVASYAHPGGNVTGLGMLSSELAGKRLQLLTEIVPDLTQAAALSDPFFSGDYEFEATRTAAEKLGVELRALEVRDPDQLGQVFDGLISQGVKGLVVFSHGFANRYRREIIAAAATHQLPAIYGYQSYIADGGLVAYGPSLPAVFYRAAYYVDRLLKGAKPADLPVELPMTFDFVVNMKTAQAIGITFPNEIMLQVTEVIQ